MSVVFLLPQRRPDIGRAQVPETGTGRDRRRSSVRSVRGLCSDHHSAVAATVLHRQKTHRPARGTLSIVSTPSHRNHNRPYGIQSYSSHEPGRWKPLIAPRRLPGEWRRCPKPALGSASHLRAETDRPGLDPLRRSPRGRLHLRWSVDQRGEVHWAGHREKLRAGSQLPQEDRRRSQSFCS